MTRHRTAFAPMLLLVALALTGCAPTAAPDTSDTSEHDVTATEDAGETVVEFECFEGDGRNPEPFEGEIPWPSMLGDDFITEPDCVGYFAPNDNQTGYAVEWHRSEAENEQIDSDLHGAFSEAGLHKDETADNSWVPEDDLMWGHYILEEVYFDHVRMSWDPGA